jgi:hypothetical protein
VKGCRAKGEWFGIEKLKPYWRNPRRRSEDSIRKIADSTAAFGWQPPIVVDKEFVVILGHGRLAAAKLLEAKQVPVGVAGNLAPDKAKALRLADNRTNRDRDWDIGLLAQEIEELRGLDVQLIGHAGFTEDDLRRIADGLDESALEKLAGAESGEDDEAFATGAAGDVPGDGSQGDGNPRATFSEVLSFEQRNVVNASIQLAKRRERLERRSDALFHICELYPEEHDESFRHFSWPHGRIADLDRQFPSYLSAFAPDQALAVEDDAGTHFGYVHEGQPILLVDGRVFHLHPGMYFSVPGVFELARTTRGSTRETPGMAGQLRRQALRGALELREDIGKMVIGVVRGPGGEERAVRGSERDERSHRAGHHGGGGEHLPAHTHQVTQEFAIGRGNHRCTRTDRPARPWFRSGGSRRFRRCAAG